MNKKQEKKDGAADGKCPAAKTTRLHTVLAKHVKYYCCRKHTTQLDDYYE